MTRKIQGLLIVLCMGLAVTAMAAEYPLTVEDLSVEGNDEVRLRDITEVIPFAVGDSIEEAELRTASQAVFDLGWFSEVSLDRAALEEGRVVFQVVENPVIEEIVITGNVHRRDYHLFGIKLFDAPIVSSTKMRQILWSNDVRKREVLNTEGLSAALQEILEEYQNRGYVLVFVGNVDPSSTLRIEFIEQEYAGSLFEGLDAVPEEVAQALVEIPTGQPLLLVDFQTAGMNLNQSVYFSNVQVDTQAGFDVTQAWLKWTLTERTLLDEPVEVHSVSIEGNTVYADDVLQALLGDVPGGSIGNYEALELVRGIHDRYMRDGYTMIELAVAATENGEMQLQVAEGEIGSVAILGNTRTRDYVIERNMELQAGRVFNRKDLLVSYQQLMSLGYFGAVDFTAEWVDGQVAVTASITEKEDLGGLGGSMAIDPSTGELYGELSLNEKNLLGTGQDVELSYSRGLVGTEDSHPSTWNLGYSTVAYFPGFERVGVNLYQKTEEVLEDEEVTAVDITLGAEISFAYPVADYSTMGLAYRHEEEHLTTESHWTPADVINLSFVFDDTNDLVFPTEGNRRYLSIEKAGGFSAGREYTKVDLTWTHFTSVTLPIASSNLDQVLAARIKTGWGDANLPTSQQLELGGPTSIRGLEGTPSRQYVFSNFEYRLELVDGLYAAAFLDAGFDLGAIRLDDMLSSVGFELGINAAGIVVRLDLAWVLAEDFTWVPAFDFAFGQMF